MTYRSTAGVLAAGLVFISALLAAASPSRAEDRTADWSGAYFGANIGWAHASYDWAFDPALAGAPNQAYSLGEDDGFLGGHAGVQVQIDQIVIGAEAAYSGSGAFGDDWAQRPRFGIGTAVSTARIDRVFTVGPRLGWSPVDRLLLFADGGYATAHVRSAGRNPVNGQYVFQGEDRHHGYYLGGGVEFAATENIVLGVEYQRIDLSGETHCAAPCAPASSNNRDIDPTVDVVRARVSLKFDIFSGISQ